MNLADVLERFRALRIVVVGDIMLDHYVWGDTHRISPEAPVPVIENQRESETAGGAANVALNLATLGIKTEVCGIVGQDHAGERLRKILLEAGISMDERFTRPETSTILKTRIIVRGQQLCRLDREDPPSRYGIEQGPSFEALFDKVRLAHAVILSDYAKGVLTQTLADGVGAAAKNQGVPIAWDPKPRRRLKVPALTCLTPNRHEAFELAGLTESRDDDGFPAQEVGRRIFSEYQPRFLVVTLGGGGMMLYDAPDRYRHLPTEAREVFDVSGAGDTVVAVLTAGLASGLDLEDAGRLANAAAGVVVGKLGTATVAPEELRRSMEAAQ